MALEEKGSRFRSEVEAATSRLRGRGNAARLFAGVVGGVAVVFFSLPQNEVRSVRDLGAMGAAAGTGGAAMLLFYLLAATWADREMGMSSVFSAGILYAVVVFGVALAIGLRPGPAAYETDVVVSYFIAASFLFVILAFLAGRLLAARPSRRWLMAGAFLALILGLPSVLLLVAITLPTFAVLIWVAVSGRSRHRAVSLRASASQPSLSS